MVKKGQNSNNSKTNSYKKCYKKLSLKDNYYCY